MVSYTGDIMRLEADLNCEVEILNANFAIITISEVDIFRLAAYPEIIYIELPKILTVSLRDSMNQSCITEVKRDDGDNLRGSGVIVAVIDSGITYTHQDFRNPDGSTRIQYIWDQTGEGTPPEGFKSGVEYTKADIDLALASQHPLSIVPVSDELGHGTAVTGIAAGNGRQSSGVEAGVAEEADIVFVKLGRRGEASFARSTEIARAVKYCVEKGRLLNKPVAINISYGTNNGAHDGTSLFEQFIVAMSQEWKCTVVVASGNEGDAGHHFQARVSQGESLRVVFTISRGLIAMYMTMWKNFADSFTLELRAPDGATTGAIAPYAIRTVLRDRGTVVTIINMLPTHYTVGQEIYFDFDGMGGVIPDGIWTLIITGVSIVDGSFNIWLPTSEEVSTGTAFITPAADVSLTLPSSSNGIITAGGYNAQTNTATTFSGRGFTRNNNFIKPDLVAPAVNVLAPNNSGRYDTFTGTSMAAPFVTGSAAIIMEWGIVKRNDPFLYGEKVKAFLQKGATRGDSRTYPNTVWGYGRLCLRETMRLLGEYRG